MGATILCIGDVMLDVVTKIAVLPGQINYGSDTPATISTHGGGAAANVASWLTRTDAQSTIVGHVGDDAADRDIHGLSVFLPCSTDALSTSSTLLQASRLGKTHYG